MVNLRNAANLVKQEIQKIFLGGCANCIAGIVLSVSLSPHRAMDAELVAVVE